jgi:hypothetical protein
VNDGETEERDQKGPPGLGALPERGAKRGSALLAGMQKDEVFLVTVAMVE